MPRNNDECLKTSDGWSDEKCKDQSLSLCEDKKGSWAKDMRRCCPEKCGTGILTKDMCDALISSGTCTYPNAAQCPEEAKSDLRGRVEK